MKKHAIRKREVVWAAALLSLLSALSCSHKPDPVPTWGYAPGSIKLHYTADRLLNRVGEKPHTLLLTVHQMSDPNVFNKLTQYEGGLRKLLEGRSVDPAITAVQKYFVEPGESKTIVLDRAENTKWVGLAAGYYSLDAGKATRVFEIPVAVTSKGFISKEKVAQIPPLELYLVFGPDSIQEKKADTQEKKAK